MATEPKSGDSDAVSSSQEDLLLLSQGTLRYLQTNLSPITCKFESEDETAKDTFSVQVALGEGSDVPHEEPSSPVGSQPENSTALVPVENDRVDQESNGYTHLLPKNLETPSLHNEVNSEKEMRIQSFKDFDGSYNFCITFSEKELISKAAPFTYSTILNKLFAKYFTPCPVQFHFNPEPPKSCVIRATPYYKEILHADRKVERCLVHLKPDDPTNTGFKYPEHVIRCDSPDAVYEKSPNGRLSVVVPYRERGIHMEFSSFNYIFTCYTSCIGGMNRQPIVVVFTLEIGDRIIGQRCIEARICACPGRDRSKCESNFLKRTVHDVPPPQNITMPTSSQMPKLKREVLDDSRDDEPKRPKVENVNNMQLVSTSFYVTTPMANVYQNFLDNVRRSAENYEYLNH